MCPTVPMVPSCSGFAETSGSLNPSTIWTADGSLYLSCLSRQGILSVGRLSLDTGAFEQLTGFLRTPEFGDLPIASWPDGRGGVYFTVRENPRLVQRADLA